VRQDDEEKRLFRAIILERATQIADTVSTVCDMLCSWPTAKIVRFRNWLRENKDSDNVPW